MPAGYTPGGHFAHLKRSNASRTGMTKPVVTEIRPAARIVGSVLLHTVSNRVTGRRTVRHWRRTVIARAVGGVSNRSAYDCPAISPPTTGAPHPQPPPLHCTVWVTFEAALAIASESPRGAAPKADTARTRSEVDTVVPSKVGCAELFDDTTTRTNPCLTNRSASRGLAVVTRINCLSPSSSVT
jgi:hypothetical protein